MHAQGIVPKIHMSIFKVFCYQKLHTHIWSILLPHKIFCCFIHIYLYIYAHWRANLMPCTHLHLFEKEFSCHLSILERQFHIIYSFWGSLFVPHPTFIKRLTTYSTCTHFIWRVFVSCYLFYIYMHMVKNIFIQTRQTSWCSPNKSGAGLKGNPYFNAFAFMFSCTQNQRLGFLGLSP